MQAVLGLVEDDRLRPINNLIHHLPIPVGGQAVHVDGVGFGEGHVLRRGLPLLVAVEDLLSQLGVVLPHGGLEHLDRSPRLGIEDVRAPGCFLKVLGYRERATSLLGVLLAGSNNLGIQRHLRWTGQHDVHAHHRGSDNGALRHGSRLVDAGGIGPGHDEPDSLEGAELLVDGEHVGQGLEGMVLVIFHVQNRDVGPIGEVAHYLVGSPIGPVHWVAVAADGDRIAHPGQHPCHVGDPLGCVGYFPTGKGRGVDLAGIQEVGVTAQLGHPGLKRVAGAQRLVVENHEQRLASQDVVVGFAHCTSSLEVQRRIQNGFDFLFAPVEQGGEVTIAKAVRPHSQLPPR